MPEWMPNLRAGYEAAETTPRLTTGEATQTGLSLSSGRLATSTDAKNASMSTCMMRGRGIFFETKEAKKRKIRGHSLETISLWEGSVF